MPNKNKKVEYFALQQELDTIKTQNEDLERKITRLSFYFFLFSILLLFTLTALTTMCAVLWTSFG